MKQILYHFKTINSTNTFLKKHTSLITPHRMILCSADYQTHGRGQYGKTWSSEPHDNLLISWGFMHPDPYWTQKIAYSLHSILAEYRIQTTIKPPNDLYIGSKKLCGILTEITGDGRCIVGIGLNVNASPSFLSTLPFPSTSLFSETQVYHHKEILAARLTDSLLCALAQKTPLVTYRSTDAL